MGSCSSLSCSSTSLLLPSTVPKHYRDEAKADDDLGYEAGDGPRPGLQQFQRPKGSHIHIEPFERLNDRPLGVRPNSVEDRTARRDRAHRRGRADVAHVLDCDTDVEVPKSRLEGSEDQSRIVRLPGEEGEGTPPDPPATPDHRVHQLHPL